MYGRIHPSSFHLFQLKVYSLNQTAIEGYGVVPKNKEEKKVTYQVEISQILTIFSLYCSERLSARSSSSGLLFDSESLRINCKEKTMGGGGGLEVKAVEKPKKLPLSVKLMVGAAAGNLIPSHSSSVPCIVHLYIFCLFGYFEV